MLSEAIFKSSNIGGTYDESAHTIFKVYIAASAHGF